MRRFFALGLLILLLLTTHSGPSLRPLLGSRGAFETEPVTLYADQPERRRAGALLFLAGWRMTSDDRAFGGLSAMRLHHGVFTAISDIGGVVRFAIVDGAPRPIGFGDMVEGPGRGFRKLDRDAEALATGAGKAWIAFERSNSIWRYSADLRRAERSSRPAAMREWPENGGAEALLRLRSGRFLVFSEAGDGPGRARAALMFAGDPTLPGARPQIFYYHAPQGYRITDAAELPDGRIVTLNRRIGWLFDIRAKVALFDPGAIRPGVIVTPRVIATLEQPMTVDNMEALTVSEEGGRTILWIASDDNLLPIQRTLLMKFALRVAPPRTSFPLPRE